ncbi:metal-dependent hydrolase [Novosphingobium flavum]|uniref:Metal-dependent hydrolase n=1 Tax=Novosphingobium flavum TaxID=1778672 RepID=A0A7X1FS35_9SPHN|nr:metal-dependent hydrolase [Novosphingobium flavum]MBC2665814.1 metal-dependent hydrolase [Novosphingobium flavum]
MDAPLPVPIEPQRPLGNTVPSQGGPAITVRDLRFGRTGWSRRWWLGGDPVASAWHNALSGTFPRGEAFFIEAVKAFRDGAPPRLAAEIRAFVIQEVNHTREHVAFNRIATEAGYDMARVDARVEAMMAKTRGRPKILDLAATMALEHWTAMMAHQFLSRPQYFAGADPQIARMWQWHAIEEIEHKGVAFDTWLHATREWPAGKRWRVRALMMAVVTWHFLRHRFADGLDLLGQDGIPRWKARVKLGWYLWVKPGVLRRIVPDWLRFFRPGFHPWDVDDRHLIGAAEQALQDA